MTISRKEFLTHSTLAAGAMAIGVFGDAHAEEVAKKKVAPAPPPPAAIHFPVLKPGEFDEQKMMAALDVKKAHKIVFQSVAPHLIVPGLASLYIHIQNALNAGEFSMGWGKGNVASAAVLYGPSVVLALNDAMWRKYNVGAKFNLSDASGKPETSNVYYKAQTKLGFDGDPGAGGNVYQDWSAEACLKRGTTFMVCHNALTAFAAMTAMSTGGDPKAILADWKSNMLPGFMIVPAGVVALQTAMEKGWQMLPLI